MLKSKENIKDFLAFSAFFCYNYIVVAKLILEGSQCILNVINPMDAIILGL